VYRHLEEIDRDFTHTHGANKSIKLTTVKPSGTLTLIAGATPGVHPGFSRYYIRRVKMASDDSLVQKCKDAGYHVEYVRGFDGEEDKRTVVVEFPIALDKKVTVAKDMTAIKQLELHKHMQTYWADNQVSVTVYYRKDELPEIKKWLAENYNDGVKTVSFLLHQDNGFHQMPYEEIDKRKYDKLMAGIKPIEFDEVEEAVMAESLECESGACPIR
jgi:ribonucleoside-diphosphate reductase alpha chain/ribonucleoside-triphosphate reductase